MKKKLQRGNLRDMYKNLCNILETGGNYYIGVESSRKLFILSEKDINKIKNNEEKTGRRISDYTIIINSNNSVSDKFKTFDLFVKEIDTVYENSIYNSDIYRYVSSEDFRNYLLTEKRKFEHVIYTIIKDFRISKDSAGSMLKDVKFDWNSNKIVFNNTAVDIRIPLIMDEYSNGGLNLDKFPEKTIFSNIYSKSADIRINSTPFSLYDSIDAYGVARASVQLIELSLATYKRITSKIINGLK